MNAEKLKQLEAQVRIGGKVSSVRAIEMFMTQISWKTKNSS